MAEDTGLKRVIEASVPLVGTWVSVSAPSVAELLATVGYEFAARDAEHASMSYETMGNLLRAVDAALGRRRLSCVSPTVIRRR